MFFNQLAGEVLEVPDRVGTVLLVEPLVTRDASGSTYVSSRFAARTR
jgi:hypothetical protein